MTAASTPRARACLLSRQPHGDGAQDDGSSVDGGELVVTGGDAPPLLVVVERALDDVAALVGDRVEGWWSAPGGPAAGAMPDLVRRLRDHRVDAALAEHGPGAARGVGLVADHRCGAGAWSAWPEPAYRELSEQRLE